MKSTSMGPTGGPGGGSGTGSKTEPKMELKIDGFREAGTSETELPCAWGAFCRKSMHRGMGHENGSKWRPKLTQK